MPTKSISVFREEVDKEQDRLLWQQEIEEEVEETKEELEREFRRKMLTYEEGMTKYQKQQQAKVCSIFIKWTYRWLKGQGCSRKKIGGSLKALLFYPHHP